MSARPAWLPVAVGLAVGAIALASTELAVLAASHRAVRPADRRAAGRRLRDAHHPRRVRPLPRRRRRPRLPRPRALACRARSSARCGQALRSPATCSAPARVRSQPCLRAWSSRPPAWLLGRPMIGATVTGGGAHAHRLVREHARVPALGAWIAEVVHVARRQGRHERPSTGVSKLSQPLMLVPPAVDLGARRDRQQA